VIVVDCHRHDERRNHIRTQAPKFPAGLLAAQRRERSVAGKPTISRREAHDPTLARGRVEAAGFSNPGTVITSSLWHPFTTLDRDVAIQRSREFGHPEASALAPFRIAVRSSTPRVRGRAVAASISSTGVTSPP
jgi:hypothetical protein